MSGKEPGGVLATIRRIKSGSLAPANLGAADRRHCVGYLSAEGVSVPEMAEMLGVSERTIARDRRAIIEANAIDPDPKLAGQVAGRLLVEAEHCIGRIRRTTREKDAPHAVRVEGERQVFSILSELTQRLQSLGYLPEAARRVEADVAHRGGGMPTVEELTLELHRLVSNREIVFEAPKEERRQLEALRDAAVRALPGKGQEADDDKSKEGGQDEQGG